MQPAVAGGTSLAAIVVTGAIIEIGGQQTHIAAETRIISYKPQNASRNNCVYGFAGNVHSTWRDGVSGVLISLRLQ